MLLIDVNVLVYAYREEAPEHAAIHAWLTKVVESKMPVGWSDLVLSAVIRLLTNPAIVREPTPLKSAIEYVALLRGQPSSVQLAPGPRHWQIFTQLCLTANVRGNLVTDAYHAALAIENGAEWITTDRDYARFPGLRWRHPLAK
jgi:hypothetical protein